MSAVIIYFSAGGRTAGVAKELKAFMDADIFEIVPREVYTAADINWINPFARCNREQLSKEDVAISGRVEDFEKYDTVYLGFPIWYGAAPKVVYSFCKQYNWANKNIYIFTTSGGGGIGKTIQKVQAVTEGAKIIEAKLVKSASELKEWAKNLNK